MYRETAVPGSSGVVGRVHDRGHDFDSTGSADDGCGHHQYMAGDSFYPDRFDSRVAATSTGVDDPRNEAIPF